jgi:hypothetical protein
MPTAKRARNNSKHYLHLLPSPGESAAPRKHYLSPFEFVEPGQRKRIVEDGRMPIPRLRLFLYTRREQRIRTSEPSLVLP